MHDKRRLRFSSIEGIAREDLPVAGEVWLDDMSKSIWVDRPTLKLANQFIQYMQTSDTALLTFRVIEGNCGLDPKALRGVLRDMQLYGVIRDFHFSPEGVRAALELTFLQRLRVLEVRARFPQLSKAEARRQLPWQQDEADIWLPSDAGSIDELIA